MLGGGFAGGAGLERDAGLDADREVQRRPGGVAEDEEDTIFHHAGPRGAGAQSPLGGAPQLSVSRPGSADAVVEGPADKWVSFLWEPAQRCTILPPKLDAVEARARALRERAENLGLGRGGGTTSLGPQVGNLLM